MFVEVLANDGGRRGRGRYYSPEAHGEDVIGCIAVLGASQVRDGKANRQSWVARVVGGGRWEMRGGTKTPNTPERTIRKELEVRFLDEFSSKYPSCRDDQRNRFYFRSTSREKPILLPSRCTIMPRAQRSRTSHESSIDDVEISFHCQRREAVRRHRRQLSRTT